MIFINGQNNYLDGGKPAYWRRNAEYKNYQYVPAISFDQEVKDHFEDQNSLYLDGAIGGLANTIASGLSNGIISGYLMPKNFAPQNLNYGDRYDAGLAHGEASVADLIHSLNHAGGVITESIKIITHSMGGAYAKGFIQAIINYAKAHPKEAEGLSITEYDFASFQQNKQHAVPGVPLYQFDNLGDRIVDGLIGKAIGSEHATEGVVANQQKDVNPNGGHSIFDFISAVSTLQEGKYKYHNGEFVKTP